MTAFDLLVEMAIDIRPVNPFDFFLDARGETMPFEYPSRDRARPRAVPRHDRSGVREGAAVRGVPRQGPRGRRRPIDRLVALNQAVHSHLKYVIREESGVWTPEQTLAAGRGSCRDSAVAAHRGAARERPRGALRERLPRAAHRRRDDPRRSPSGVIARRGRPARLGRGLPARRGVDRPRRDERAALRRGAHPARVHGAPGRRRADGRDERRAGEARSTFEMKVGRLGHEPRPTAPFPEETWAELLAGGRSHRRARSRRAGIAAHRRRRADVHVAPPPRGARVERRRARRDEVGAGRRARRGAARAPRPGRRHPAPVRQALPGREPPAVGARHPRATRRGAAGAESERDRARPGDRRRREAPRQRARRAARRRARTSRSSVRGPVAPAARRGATPRRRRPAARRPSTTPRSDGGSRVCSIAASPREAGFVLPLSCDATGWRSHAWTFRREHLFLVPGDSPIGLRSRSTRSTARRPSRSKRRRTTVLADPRRGDARRRGRESAGEDRGRSARRTERTASAPRSASSRATAGSSSSSRRSRAPGASASSSRAIDATAASLDLRVVLEGLPAAAVARAPPPRRHARSRRARGEHPADAHRRASTPR